MPIIHIKAARAIADRKSVGRSLPVGGTLHAWLLRLTVIYSMDGHQIMYSSRPSITSRVLRLMVLLGFNYGQSRTREAAQAHSQLCISSSSAGADFSDSIEAYAQDLRCLQSSIAAFARREARDTTPFLSDRVSPTAPHRKAMLML